MEGEMDGIKETRRTLLISLLLAGAALAVFWPVRHFEFLNWDDLTYVKTNEHVQGITWGNVVWAFTQSYAGNWHPLTWLSHGLDYQLFGPNAGAHHLVNVGFHLANTLLLFGFLRFATGAFWRSALVAALFALHPLHVESVAWIAERKDVLSTFFFLLTVWAYPRYVKSKVQSPKSKVAGKEPGVGNPKSEIRSPKEGRSPKSGAAPQVTRTTQHATRWYVLALVLFACGLMSKPMLVTLPFVLLLLDYWPLGRFGIKIQNSKFKNLLIEKLPFFTLAAASSLITFLAQKKGGAVAPLDLLPFDARAATAVVAYCQYLLKFFWPAGLSPLYPHPAQWGWWRVVGAVVALGLLTAGAWAGRRRFPYLLTGWFWFVGTLVPVIGLVQVGSQAYADRYTYIPLIGLMVALVWLAAESGRNHEIHELHEMSTAGGDPREAAGIGAAGFRVFRVFRGYPAAVLAVTIVGALAWRASAQLMYWKDTETLFGRALALEPDNPQALHVLGALYGDTGRAEAGKRLLERALQLRPHHPETLGSMGDLLDGQGKYAEAIEYYHAALKLKPDHPGMLNNLAWLRASCPDPACRDGAEGVELARRACELTGYRKPLFIGTLAAAQAQAGDFQGAIATAERAAALATALHLEEIAARNRELIELYRRGRTAKEME